METIFDDFREQFINMDQKQDATVDLQQGVVTFFEEHHDSVPCQKSLVSVFHPLLKVLLYTALTLRLVVFDLFEVHSNLVQAYVRNTFSTVPSQLPFGSGLFARAVKGFCN